MKKMIALVLAVGMIFALCACSGSRDRAFVGTWHGTDKDGDSCSVTFKNNGSWMLNPEGYSSWTGTWETFEKGTATVTSNFSAVFTFKVDENGVLHGSSPNYAGSPMEFTK